MRFVRTALAAAAALAAALVAAGLDAPAAPVSVERTASLAIVDHDPLTVRGRGFRRGERVTVTARVSGAATGRKTVRASRQGGFATTFLSVDRPCEPIVVVALGSAGSRAVARQHEIPPPCGISIAP